MSWPLMIVVVYAEQETASSLVMQAGQAIARQVASANTPPVSLSLSERMTCRLHFSWAKMYSSTQTTLG